MQIRRSVLSTLVLAFSAMAIAFLWSDNHKRDAQLRESFDRMASTVEKLINSEVRADQQVMEAALDAFTENTDLQKALASEHVDKLIEIVQTNFARLKQRNQISHLYFHRINLTNLYRLHEPSHHDDKIDRPSLKTAEKTGVSSFGLEQGPTGASVLRVVQPVRLNGRVVGYMELGKEFQDIVTKIEGIVGLKAVVLVDKAKIKRDLWETRNNKIKFDVSWDFLEKYAVTASTIATLPIEIKDILVDGKSVNSAAPTALIKMEGDTYQALDVPYLGVDGQKVADIILFYNCTSLLASQALSAEIAAAIVLLIFIFLIGFFYIYIGRIENLLAEQQSSLVHTSKMTSLGEMAAGIAHEINSPLSAIALNAQLIQLTNDSLPEPGKEIGKRIGSIIEIGERIAKIINGLQGFARQESNDEVKGSFSINEAVTSTLDMCAERFKNHGVDLIVAPIPEASVRGHAHQFSQVLLNLLNNSFDAVSETSGSWIKIESKLEGTMVVVSVTDSGPGLSKQVVEKMFQPFFTTKDYGKGTGLGLSLSKGLAKSLGGKLSYDSASANTRFLLEVPLSVESQEALA